MGMINGIRALNALTSGTMTGAQLTTYLATSNNAGSFQQLLSLRGQTKILTESTLAMSAVAASSTAMTAVAASSTAMTAVAVSSTALTAVIASSTAMTAVAASSTAMTAVAASSTAMTAVAASSTAMTAVAASSTARLAVFNSDVALSAIAASSIAIAAIKAAPTYVINSTASVGTTAITTTLSGNYIMIGWSDSPSSVTTTITGRKAGSTVGTLAGTSISVGTLAATNNIMALTSPVTVANSNGAPTVYLGVLPV
jgi:hypothetical protein